MIKEDHEVIDNLITIYKIKLDISVDHVGLGNTLVTIRVTNH